MTISRTGSRQREGTQMSSIDEGGGGNNDEDSIQIQTNSIMENTI